MMLQPSPVDEKQPSELHSDLQAESEHSIYNEQPVYNGNDYLRPEARVMVLAADGRRLRAGNNYSTGGKGHNGGKGNKGGKAGKGSVWSMLGGLMGMGGGGRG